MLMPMATVDRSVATGFATVTHAALLLPVIVLGQLFLWTGHISLRKLVRASQANPEAAHSSEPTSSSPVTPTSTPVSDEGGTP